MTGKWTTSQGHRAVLGGWMRRVMAGEGSFGGWGVKVRGKGEGVRKNYRSGLFFCSRTFQILRSRSSTAELSDQLPPSTLKELRVV